MSEREIRLSELTTEKPDCERCEGSGNYSEMAPCTTFGPDCGCHERVLVDPCPDCGGSGYVEVRALPTSDA